MNNWTLEQREAIEREGCNIIVSAGAGSGKTAVLTERVMRKLKNGINIDQILVLTFTNAAAHEMKERIREAITIDPSLHSQLDLIDSAYITTFDSFSLSIVKKYHYLLNMSKDIAIIDSSIIYNEKVKILDDIMKKKYGERDSDFLKLIGDFCVKDDEEIKKYLLQMNDKMDLLMDKRTYLDSYIDKYFAVSFINSKLEEYMHRIDDKFLVIKDAAKDLLSLAENKLYDQMLSLVNRYDVADDYEKIFSVIHEKLPSVPSNSSQEIKSAKDNLSKAVAELVDYMELPTLSSVREKLLMTLPYSRIIVKIIKELDERLTDFKNSNNSFEFNDIAKMAIEIVEKNPDVRAYLKDFFKEIMIDEYQDTSNIQEKFINLIADDDVYMVGDIKQSIYRFRNADPNIFKDKYDCYSKSDGGIKIDLLKNFRSRDEVLNNINLIFDAIMDDEIGGARYQETHRMIFGNKAYVEEGLTDQNYDMEIYDYDFDSSLGYSEDEIEIFTIVKDIKDKIANGYQVFDKKQKVLRKVTYSDFCILLDRSSSFDLYKKVFEYFNIPLTKYTSTNIKKDDDILIIKNILTLLTCMKNEDYGLDFRYAYTSIGRSYLFRYSDEELFDQLNDGTYKETALYDKLSIINEVMDTLSLSKIIERVVDEFAFYLRSITVGDMEKVNVRIEYILDLATNMEAMGFGVEEFRDYLERIIESDEKIECEISENIDDSVKIMTIHKSKGLEYHICYFAQFKNRFNLRESQSRFIFSEKYGMIIPYFEEGIGDTFYKVMYREDYLKDEISEKIRLLYVALTRCKEKMIVIGNFTDDDIELENVVAMSIRNRYRSFKDIIDSVISLMHPYLKKVDLQSLGLTHDYNLIKKTNYRAKLSKTKERINDVVLSIPNAKRESQHFSKMNNTLLDSKTKEKMQFGTYMHYLFEMIDFKNPDLTKVDCRYRKYLEMFLSSGIDFSGNIYKEYEFLYEMENISNHGVIDMMIEHDDHIDIIDYKLKRIDDLGYVKQLEGYRSYLHFRTSKRVNIYLYSIITGELKELNNDFIKSLNGGIINK